MRGKRAVNQTVHAEKRLPGRCTNYDPLVNTGETSALFSVTAFGQQPLYDNGRADDATEKVARQQGDRADGGPWL
jgi:hypothetical protein